ncbi:unnamed protein product [Rotaria sp. Silwood2]|nr:unnamed protein product [Rotaria sp. Silwood2]CAF4589249.1 unnamed protein product [Rotaria sp. Silwood2]
MKLIVSDDFKDEQVLLRLVALQKKIFIRRSNCEKSYELFASIEVYVDYFFLYAQYDASLYSVLQRIYLFCPNNNQFSIYIIYKLFDELFLSNTQTYNEDKQVWKDIEDKPTFLCIKINMFIFVVVFFLFDTTYRQLSKLIEIDDLIKTEFSSVDQKQMEQNHKSYSIIY